jgi:hypothetical protein
MGLRAYSQNITPGRRPAQTGSSLDVLGIVGKFSGAEGDRTLDLMTARQQVSIAITGM